MNDIVIQHEGSATIEITPQAPRPIVVSLVSRPVSIQRPGVQGAKGEQGEQGETGAAGADGNDGWTPILAVATDGERRVQQVVDWTGGEGAEPASGLYVGASGLVVDIADGVDIRGAAGSTTGDMVKAVYDPQGIEADAFDRANHTGTQTLATISDAGTMAAEAATDYTKTVDLAAVALSGAYVDLSGTPSLAAVATSGAYVDLSGTPSLATVATTGAYSDLTGKPTLGGAAALNVGTSAGTVAAGNHTHAAATTSIAGFLSATDKAKLDALDNASRVISVTTVSSSVAAIDIIIPAGYSHFKLFVQNLTTNANNIVNGRFSYDGGSTFLSASSSYSGTAMAMSSASFAAGFNSLATEMVLGSSWEANMDLSIFPGAAGHRAGILSTEDAFTTGWTLVNRSNKVYTQTGRVTTLRLYSTVNFAANNAKLTLVGYPG